MPKKTKQWGWQCSECDKEPEMHPISYTPQIDIEAPRSSRNRGPPKANNLLCKYQPSQAPLLISKLSQVTQMWKVL